MAAGHRYRIDGFGALFIRQLLELVVGKISQI